MKRILTILIAVCVAFAMSTPISLMADGSGYEVYAAKATKENENAQMGHSIKKLKTGNEKEDVVDGTRVLAVGGNGGEDLTKFFSGYQAGYLVGIDVSYWQGNINWDKVANEVDFAILRCGYGKNVTSKDDSTFAKNAKACEDRGIPYGVYLYSYANTVAKAEDEADHCLRLLKGHEPDLPVYYDLEDSTVSKAGSSMIKKMAKAFCKRISDNGYKAGVYASLSWWDSKIGTSVNGYSKWVAQWYSKCSASDADIWQFSSNGTVPGISGRVDMNEMMIPKSEMDAFMDGAYTKFSGTAENVDNYEAIVLNNNAEIKMGPGCGFRSAGNLAAGTVVNVSEIFAGYAHLTDADAVNIRQLEGGLTEGGTPEFQGTDDEDKTDSWILLSDIVRSDAIKGWVETEEGKKLQRYNGEFVTNGVAKFEYYYYCFDENGILCGPGTAIVDGKEYLINENCMVVLNKSKMKKTVTCRSGASTKYKKKGKLKKGKTVKVIRTSGSWSKADTGQWFKTSSAKITTKYPKVVTEETK